MFLGFRYDPRKGICSRIRKYFVQKIEKQLRSVSEVNRQLCDTNQRIQTFLKLQYGEQTINLFLLYRLVLIPLDSPERPTPTPPKPVK